MANIIKIKRGLSSDLSKVSLQEGEIAFTTDTKKLYVSTTAAPINENTTYTLTKSGSTITLTGSDGSTTSVADSNTTYTHPTTSGNKHIPAGGSSGQILRWSASGTAVWGADNNTTYTFSDGLSADGTTVSNSGVREISTGTSNGTISVNTNGTSANVSVKGLAGAAYKAVDTSISAASTSTNLPTSKAVAAFVEGKGYKTTDNNTTYTFATGDANGQIKITPSGGSAQNVSVKGLGSLAYKSSLSASDVGALASSSKGAASGVAELDASGKVPTSQLPSYVDDVIEYSAKSGFPTTGETGKIYVDTSTNKTWRWGGSAYVEISPSLALGTTSSTAFRGDYGNTAYTHATAKGSAFSSGLYKITTNAQGHVTAATAVAKADITALGIPGSDTTYSVATTSANGLLSSTDKTKLDGIATGATKNTASSTTPKAAGTAAVGSEANYARGDHVHPAQTTITGNAGSATKVNNSLTLTKNGSNTTFNGSAAKTISIPTIHYGSEAPSNTLGQDGDVYMIIID